MSKKTTVMSHDPLADLDPDAESAQAEGAVGPLAFQAGEESASGSDDLVLPSSLTIREVAEMHPLWTGQLVSDGTVTIDASAVEIIDGAGLQLLAALSKGAEQRNSALAWRNVPPVLTEAVAQLGLQTALKLDGSTSVLAG